MARRRPTIWWFICEACLRPFMRGAVYCAKCLRDLVLCDECTLMHDGREHQDTVPIRLSKGIDDAFEDDTDLDEICTFEDD